MKLDLLFCNTKNEFKLLFNLSIIILCYKVNKNFTFKVQMKRPLISVFGCS